VPVTLDSVRPLVDAVLAKGPTRLGPLAAGRALVHCAQSLELAVSGFPRLKPRLFRATVGPLAASIFLARDRLSHELTAMIPGAEVISDDVPLAEAGRRLLTAIDAFQAAAARGSLHPHFAYGAQSPERMGRLQALHVLDHLRDGP
jgi:hypothetical protein